MGKRWRSFPTPERRSFPIPAIGWSRKRSPRASPSPPRRARPRRSPRFASPALPTDRFFFEGFLPPKRAARRERINALAAVPGTLIFYEAPGRLAETLADLALELGPRPAAVARELTKLHEEVRRGALDKLAAEYAGEEAPRGEIVIVVGAAEARTPIADDVLDREIAELLANLSVRDAAAAVAAKHGLPRRQVYARALALAGAAR